MESRDRISSYRPEGVVEGVHLAAVEGDVLLRVVGRGGAGREALGDGLLDVGRIVLGQSALFPGAGVAWGTHTRINRLRLRTLATYDGLAGEPGDDRLIKNPARANEHSFNILRLSQ
ncbi:hypothetical protein EVAR_82282_1 [Eumeta japonica]|uniref:Uncharacterized protein n=1 Tax=Eumeta variegata TaxID=151549 RepID=A0A4C1VZ36_EUMVA|nr:hypothetical protein EVAR_82282_1 [Eumeta japonica]